jgi:pimeloyl-ACP methyl ester carboxylesterase
MNTQVTYLKAMAACLVLLCNAAYAAVITPIEAPGKDKPTLTLLMEAEKPATATVLFIPGGDGRTGLQQGITEPRGPFFVGILKPLTRSSFNVVLVDDPDGIDFKTGYSPDRRLDRIESVLKYYQSKLKTPMILFGHSHGSNAVMRFVNRSADNDKLIAGIVLSSSRVPTRAHSYRERRRFSGTTHESRCRRV